MGFFKDFARGLSAYGSAVDFSRKHNLWGYYVIPALLNLVIFAGVGAAAWFLTDDLILRIEQLLDIQAPESTWKQVAHAIFVFLIRLFVLFAYLKLYRYLMLILLSPVLAIVGERVQELLHGREAPGFNFVKLVRDIGRAVMTAMRDLVVELSITIGLFVLGFFIPILAPFITVFMFGMESYFFGVSMIDYRNEFLEMSPKESRALIWRRKGFAIANGTGFTLLMFIPVAGVLIAPILSVVAAGVGMHQLEGQAIEYAAEGTKTPIR